MKILFLKDVTVDIMDPDSGSNDTYDRLMRQGVSVEGEVCQISRGFSNLYLHGGEVLLDVRNDCFAQES